MKYEINFSRLTFAQRMLVHSQIGKLRFMQLNAVIGGHTEAYIWIKEEIADLKKSLGAWK